MTDHPSSEELLDLALQLLAKREAEALRAHIAACEACGLTLTKLEQEQATLASALAPLPAPAGLEGRILAALPAGAGKITWRKLVTVAAASLIAVGVGLYAQDDPGRRELVQQLVISERLALGLEERP